MGAYQSNQLIYALQKQKSRGSERFVEFVDPFRPVSADVISQGTVMLDREPYPDYKLADFP